MLRTFYDARTAEQETGVNTLFLALGFLKWYEDATTEKARYAPLLLVPVTLERRNARTRFSLRYDEGELNTNLSLQAKLRADFGIDLPDLSTVDETFEPSAYFAQVREAVGVVARWEVLDDDAVLSFFSFSKFLMYRDLDAEQWEAEGGGALGAHPLLGPLLGEGVFMEAEPVIGDEVMLDAAIPARDWVHVVQADTSQTIAIEAVRAGRNLVIQGPPGTGKSQTIANLIAAAVKEGRRVLFVAEKMAALDVVQRRLTEVGLGEMCLELHSHKARKRAVLDSLERAMALGKPTEPDAAGYFERLSAARDTLNAHARELHEPIGESGVTTFEAIGRLVRLRSAGVEPAPFTLNRAATWTAAEAAEARQTLNELLERLADTGTPGEHAWRGVQVAGVLPMDVARMKAQWPGAEAALRAAAERGRALAGALGHDDPPTPVTVERDVSRARRLAAAPPLDGEAITHDVWAQQGSAVSELVAQGQALAAARKQLDGRVTPAAYTADLGQTRLDLAAFGRSWLRFLNGAYRRAQARLRGIVTGPVPKGLDERLQLIDRVLEVQRAMQAIDRDDAIGRYAFGSRWRGEASDWDNLSAVHGWNRRNDELGDAKAMREFVAAVDEPAALAPLADAAESASSSAGRAFDAAAAPLQLDLAEAFGVASWDRVKFAAAAERLGAWGERPDGLFEWIAFRDLRAEARDAGLAPLTDRLDEGTAAADGAAAAFEMAYHEALIRRAYAEHPALATFDGDTHGHVVEAFCSLDRERIALARQEVAAAHYAGIPRGRAAAGQVGVLLSEFNRKRGHLPIRQLLREAGDAIQRVKPVFMMSPMSVAQYLEPGGITFDVMVTDEASQVQPVDALGAVARARQMVVVGDDKQLPPTSFFDSLSRDDGADEEELQGAAPTADLESILGLCKARGMPDAMLRWHYRSRHPSLIAVSNHEFYDGRLFVIPTPSRGGGGDGLGLHLHRVTEGHYDRGGTRTHDVEARQVAEAVMRHAREHPDLTLGVGTFSVAQRDAVVDHLEVLRRADPSAEGFFVEGGAEPFFVKNLENIQGDERDVIYISVGYGRDGGGKLTMNFGPVSSEGGERRLNVLITRAKLRCEVFSSITADDIDLGRVSQRGPAALRSFLHFAEHGTFLDERATGAGYGSVFEEAVGEALVGRGYAVEPRVGTRGFSVDLAVVDPDASDDGASGGGYVLGIECDGRSYGEARSARERDRARRAVLEMMGWTIYRLWSVDWFNRPGVELERLIEAIEAARGSRSGGGADADAGAAAGAGTGLTLPRGPGLVIDREAAASEGGVGADRFAGIPTAAYAEASFRKEPRVELDGLDVFQRIELVRRIVEAEGPVHGEEVGRRAAEVYRVERYTARVSELMAEAVRDAANAGKVAVDDDGFCTLPGGVVEVVRDRSGADSAGLRKPEMLPPAEVGFALRGVARAAIGVSRDEAVIEVSRLLGFASTRAALRGVIERELDRAVGAGELVEREGGLFVGEGEGEQP